MIGGNLFFRRGAGRAWIFAGGLLAAILSPTALPGWEIRSFEGRNHVSLDEVASFYQLAPAATSSPDTKRFSGAGRDLTVTANRREILINGIAHWLAFPVLEQDGKFFLCRLDLGKTVEPAFRPERIPGFPAVNTVVLDAGHGGRDNGAHSPYEFEKNFALDVARRVRNELRKSGVRVVLTRNSDSFVELPARAAAANRLKDAIFVSMHFNATDENRAANGFEIYCATPRGAPSTAYEQLSERDMVGESGNEHDLHSFALANTISHSMHGQMTMTDRGVKRARFAVLRLARVPAVLIEGGFLTNPGDARNIASRPWRDAYAAAIARGILEYRNLAASQAGAPAPPPAGGLPDQPAPARN